MDAFQFHAMGNADEVRDLLEGIVWITGQGDYALVAALLLTTGFVLVLARGAVCAQGRQAVFYLAAAILFWFAAVVPGASVVISDQRSETVRTVDHVPLGIAFAASLASSLGTWLVEGYEAAFVPVEAARFARFGAVYPERVVEVLKSTGPVTAEARTNLDALITACVLPEVMTDAAKASALLASGDLWGTISAEGWMNPARIAAMPEGGVAYCPAAAARVAEILTRVELPALKRVLGAKLAPDAADPSGVVARVVPQAEGLLLGMSRDLDSSLRHALVTTSMTENAGRAAAEGGGTLALAVGLSQAQGNLASEINYRTMARIGADFLPKVRNSLEIVVLGLFPVTVLLALVSGHALGSVLKSYFMVLATLELWPTAASLVNFLMIERDVGAFGALISAYGADSLAAAALIRETGASAQAVAGGLMLAVPVICYMAVCGGTMAIGQMTGGLTAPAQSAAQSQGAGLAAGNVAQGNVSLGNVSAHTESANSSNRSIRSTGSSTVATQTAYGSVTRDLGGTVTGMSRTGVDLGVSSGVMQSERRGETSDYAAAMTGTSTRAVHSSTGAVHSSQSAVLRTFSHVLNETVAQSASHGGTWSQNASAGTGGLVMETTDHARTNRVSDGMSVQSQGAYGVQAGLSPGVEAGARGVAAPGLGLQGAVRANSAQELIDQATGRATAASRTEQRTAYQTVHDAAARIASTHSDAAVRQVARNFAENLSQQRTLLKDAGVGVSHTTALSSGMTQGREAERRIALDETPELMRAAIERYGSAEGALRAVLQGAARTDVAAAHEDRHEDSPRFGVRTVGSALQRNAGSVEAVENQLNRAASRGERDFEAARREALPGLEAVEKAVRAAPAGAALTEEIFDREVAEVNKGLAANQDRTAFQRGLLMISREAYRRDNERHHYALVNAFLGGISYQSPAGLQQKLREKAEASPRLRASIAAVGAKAGSDVTEDEWRRLAAAAH